MTLKPVFVELLAKQDMSYKEIACLLHSDYYKVWACAQKHSITVKSTRGGARAGSGCRVDFNQEWSDYMLLRLFDNNGNPVHVSKRGAIQKAFYQEMCWWFEEDDFQRKCKPITLWHKFKNMKKDIQSGKIKIVIPNDIDWEE